MPIASALSRKVSRTLQRYLTHTYTRTAVTAADTEDAWGDEDATPGSGVSGLPCLYGSELRLIRDQAIRDEFGSRTVTTPTLFVPPADPLKVGDVVTNILDAAGGVVLAGPLVVETVALNNELGLSVMKSCALRGVTATVNE